jgi:hypothetical protein
VLKREEISKAMRSCYPDFVVSRRKAELKVGGFDDVELFLANHEITFPADESEFFPEQEVAEVLASTWKEKRAEIAKLQKAHRFDQAKELRRSFRVEIEELKKKTKCNRCHRVGHWARECRQKRDSSSKPSSSTASQSKSSQLVMWLKKHPCLRHNRNSWLQWGVNKRWYNGYNSV